MKNFYKQFIYLSLSLFLVSQTGKASQELTTNSFKTIDTKIEELSKKYGAENVLVVFDCDNTLLATNQSLGSDQWFDWQSDLLFAKGKKSPYLVADNFDDLLSAQGLLFSFSKMSPPEKEIPAILAKLQKKGHKAIVLTSRGPGYRYDTIRELWRNGMTFEKSGFDKVKSDKVRKAFKPKKVVKKYNFKKENVKPFKLTKARDAAYLRGVFFTAGQHKGAMLRILLHKAKFKPKAIVFADDKKKHTVRVQAAYKDSGIDVVTFHYTKEDVKVQSFKKENKKAVDAQWRSLTKAISSKNPGEVDKVARQIFK